MTKAKLTSSQERVIKYLKNACMEHDTHGQEELYEITKAEIKETPHGAIWFYLDITRTGDCEEYSPRRLICSTKRTFLIGKRGSVTRFSFSQGLTSHHDKVKGLGKSVYWFKTKKEKKIA